MATLSLSTLQGVGYAPTAGQRSLADLRADRQPVVPSTRGPLPYRPTGGIPEAGPAAGRRARVDAGCAHARPRGSGLRGQLFDAGTRHGVPAGVLRSAWLTRFRHPAPVP